MTTWRTRHPLARAGSYRQRPMLFSARRNNEESVTRSPWNVCGSTLPVVSTTKRTIFEESLRVKTGLARRLESATNRAGTWTAFVVKRGSPVGHSSKTGWTGCCAELCRNPTTRHSPASMVLILMGLPLRCTTHGTPTGPGALHRQGSRDDTACGSLSRERTHALRFHFANRVVELKRQACLDATPSRSPARFGDVEAQILIDS
jgi:hypothetical protein